MPTPVEAIDSAIDQADAARGRIRKIQTNQVRDAEQIASLKSTAYAWFNTHRPTVARLGSSVELSIPDECYQKILDATARYAVKNTYLNALKEAKRSLVKIRSDVMTVPPPSITGSTDDLAPPRF